MNRTYDREHIYLIPRPSSVNSRDDVDLSIDLESLKLKMPIIGSPMKGIMNTVLAKKLSDWGGIGILHRFCDQKEFETSIVEMQGHNFGQAIGLGEMERAEYAIESGAKIICVDVANGYLSSVVDFCCKVNEYIQSSKSDALLMSGNIVTYEGAKNLARVGVKLIRCGIGVGFLCRTRQKTRIGFGQITALQNCSNIENAYTVSDGGIKEPGDVVLDLAAGADVVMIGSLLAHTFESAHDGIIYGMASRRNQEEYHHNVKSVEGIEQDVQKTMGFDAFMSEFLYGIKSSFTYQNARNISELQAMAKFVEIR